MCGTLIHRDVGRQTVSFALKGAFKHSNPELTSTLQAINDSCPHLFSHLTAANPKKLNDKTGDEDADAMKAVADPQHFAPAVQLRIPPADVTKQIDPLLSVVFPRKLDSKHPFKKALFNAYRKDYNAGALTDLGRKGVQWAKRARFTVP